MGLTQSITDRLDAVVSSAMVEFREAIRRLAGKAEVTAKDADAVLKLADRARLPDDQRAQIAGVFEGLREREAKLAAFEGAETAHEVAADKLAKFEDEAARINADLIRRRLELVSAARAEEHNVYLRNCAAEDLGAFRCENAELLGEEPPDLDRFTLVDRNTMIGFADPAAPTMYVNKERLATEQAKRGERLRDLHARRVHAAKVEQDKRRAAVKDPLADTSWLVADPAFPNWSDVMAEEAAACG